MPPLQSSAMGLQVCSLQLLEDREQTAHSDPAPAGASGRLLPSSCSLDSPGSLQSRSKQHTAFLSVPLASELRLDLMSHVQVPSTPSHTEAYTTEVQDPRQIVRLSCSPSQGSWRMRGNCLGALSPSLWVFSLWGAPIPSFRGQCLHTFPPLACEIPL